MSAPGRFHEKVAIVTGAAGDGIGQAVARAFVREGARVMLADIAGKKVTKISEELNASGAETLAVKCDVSKREQVEEMVKMTVEKWGRIDILVNDAAVNPQCELVNMSDELWERTIGVSLNGTFYCSRAVLPTMITRKYGRIINFASGIVLQPLEKHVHYASAKAGVIGFTRSLAVEVGKYNITVNCVCPIVIWNDLISGMGYQPGFFDRIKEEIPLRRLGKPGEAASLVLFLASDEASYLSGDTITIGGGRNSI